MVRSIAVVIALLSLLVPGSPRADSPGNLALDVAHVSPRTKDTVFAAPERDARVISNDAKAEYIIGGVLSNVQGRWYEVIYPVHGWMRESDALFTNEQNEYNPSRIPEPQRIVLRLMCDIGAYPARWEKSLGRPWSEDSWREERDGTPVAMHTAVWPGVAIVTAKAEDSSSDPVIVKATICGTSRVGFGPYALGEPGGLLRRLSGSFKSAPFAELATGNFRFMLDEDAKISFLSYSADGENFLGCPQLAAPDPDDPFYTSSIYPAAMCRRMRLFDALSMEGEYTGFGCDENCSAEIRMDSGMVKDVQCSREEAMRSFGTKEGVRVRVVYTVEQAWNDAKNACEQYLSLRNGRVQGAGESSVRVARRACQNMTVVSGEAQGEVRRVGNRRDDEPWEIQLDSDRPLAFHMDLNAPVPSDVREGTRVSVRYERIQRWSEDELACLLETRAMGPIRAIPSRGR